MSPLSHAMITDTFLQGKGGPRRRDPNLVKRALRAVESHRRKIQANGGPTYALPNHEAIRIWSEIRGAEINIPAYDDGVATYPAQSVGPDELLVFATAAAISVPLFGPAPTAADTLELLKDVGITFKDPPIQTDPLDEIQRMLSELPTETDK